MLRILTASSILALCTVPAVAQEVDPAAAPAATEIQAAPEASVTPAPAATPDATVAPAPAATAPVDEAARETTVTSLVEAEFPSYDADKNGDLNQTEFGAWVLALHSKAEEGGAAPKKDDATKAKWAKDAFATADSDKNKKISKAEVSKFLLG